MCIQVLRRRRQIPDLANGVLMFLVEEPSARPAPDYGISGRKSTGFANRGYCFRLRYGIRLVEVSTDVVIGASIFGLLYLTRVVLRPALVIVGGTR